MFERGRIAGSRLRGASNSVLSDRRGVTALEFGILSVAFWTLALGTMEVGYDFFVQAVLDTAVQDAARSVQVGSAKGNKGESIADFVKRAVCPGLGPLLNCANLLVSVTPIPSGAGENYGTYLAANPITLALTVSSSGGTVDTGAGGQLMLIRAFYLSPTFICGFVPSFSVDSPINPGHRVHVSFASAGFVNEYF